MQGIWPYFVVALLLTFGCAEHAAAPRSPPPATSSAAPALPPANAPAPPSQAQAARPPLLDVQVRTISEATPLGDLYDDSRARALYAQQPPGVTISGPSGALLLVARFSAWWQGGEISDPPPLTSVRVASLQGLDAEQSRVMVRLFVETHGHEAQLWLSDPTSLAGALAEAEPVIDDPRAHGECRPPCAPWPWQTRWSVLEIAARAAWREGDNTRDTARLDAAIARGREALRAIPDAAHPLTAAVTERLLGATLDARAELDPQRRGLEDALAASRRALAAFAAPELRVDRSFTEHNIEEHLRQLGQRDASAARYAEALAVSNEELQNLDAQVSPLAHARALLLRADVLQDEYDSLDDREALSAARDLVVKTLPLLSPGASPLLLQGLYGTWCSASTELGARTGDAAELEQAVNACERALALAPEVRKPRPSLDVAHGLALCRLGEARSDVGLLRRAVAQISEGLANLDAHAALGTRAKAYNNLAVALHALANHEDQRNNLARAGAAFEQSLALSSKQSDPMRWAKNMLGRAETERRLGWVERSRLQMDAAKAHYETALRAIDDALTVVTKKTQPAFWATLQERAGDILAREGEIAEGYHFNQAVARYQRALSINRRASDPAAYATTQFGLGVAYLFWADQSVGLDHIRSIAKKSASAFREALAIRAQLGLVPSLGDTKAHLADAVEIVDRVSYRSTCEPQTLLAEAVHDDAKAMGLWEPAAKSLARYQQAKGAEKCSPH